MSKQTLVTYEYIEAKDQRIAELEAELKSTGRKMQLAVSKELYDENERLREAIDGLPCYDTGACNAWPENDGSDWTCDACAAVAALGGGE